MALQFLIVAFYTTVHFLPLFTGGEHYQNLQSLHFLLLG
jgi:hypothetical protein